MTEYIKLIKLLRPHQWLKNLFIFAPILFSFNFLDIAAIINTSLAFIGFSFIASSIYIINDWLDIESDKLHPRKKKRPLASGAVSKLSAFWICLLLIICGFCTYIFFIKNILAISLLAAYFILNLAYCFKLKHVSIIDITIVSLGFVIRLFIGAIVANINLSHWLIIMTFLLALLLVIGKRRHDVGIYESTGQQMRKSLVGYNSDFLNSIIIIIVSVSIISYIMYTISDEVVSRNGQYLYLTSIFVILGFFRYLQVLFVEKKGDSPTELIIKDKFLQINIVLWIVSFIIVSIF